MRQPDPLRPSSLPPLQRARQRTRPPDERALAGTAFGLMLLVAIGVLMRLLGIFP